MTQQTVTITYDDADLHNTMEITTTDAAVGAVKDGVVAFFLPSYFEDTIQFSVFNFGKYTGSEIARYAAALAQHIIQNR